MLEKKNVILKEQKYVLKKNENSENINFWCLLEILVMTWHFSDTLVRSFIWQHHSKLVSLLLCMLGLLKGHFGQFFNEDYNFKYYYSYMF